MARCQFLETCQELRDMIYEYALVDDITDEEEDEAVQDALFGEQHDTRGHELLLSRWKLQYRPLPRSPTWLSLLRCNRQLAKEVRTFMASKHSQSEAVAKATVYLKYPYCTTQWQTLPRHPADIETLDLLIKVDYMYHPDIQPPSDKLFAIVFELMKRYTHHGPYLARVSKLGRPLSLENVRLTFTLPHRNMDYIYGNPRMQLMMLYESLRNVMIRCARSGLIKGAIGGIQMRTEDNPDETIDAKGLYVLEDGDALDFRQKGYWMVEGDDIVP